MRTRESILVKASWISIIGNAILAILKLSFGLLSGSLAVVGDGIDSASDIIISLIMLVTAKIVSKPPDIRFPYGYGRADTIAAKVLSFVIFFAGFQLALATIKNLFSGDIRELPTTLAIYVTVVSIIGKVLLSVYQYKVSKITQSKMLEANAQNMKNDVLISLTVLIGLVFTYIFKLPIVDSVTAFLVSLWIIRSAIILFFQTNIDLMDGMTDSSLYSKVVKAVEKIKEAKNPHRIRIRKLGNLFTIAIDIEVDEGMKVKDAHKVAMDVENQIKDCIDNIYDIVVHIEPIGNYEKNEKYGVSKSDIVQS